MNKLGRVLTFLVIASCDFPRPARIGPDDAGPQDAEPGSASCQLTAIGPSIANTNDTITIEGTFGDAVTVNFPGGASAAATVLGPHRAIVSVPASATQGDLTVTTCGSTFGALQFRTPSFAVGMRTFSSSLEQATGARQYPNLAVRRASHTSMVIGDNLYVLGGVAQTGSLNSVERSLVNADGTLGRFIVMPEITLVVPRQSHTTVAIKDRVYVLGGFGNGSLNSVEHAIVGASGAIGPFTILAESSLMTARQGHTSAVIGNYVYVLGGLGSGLLNSVERAIIHDDGSLGPFATVPGATLATARRGHASVVIGSYLYVIGGAGTDGALSSVERATINGDGSLGAFSPASGTRLTTGRSGSAVAVIGSSVYVFGGVGGSGSLNSVERAAIAVDGSLGAFETIADVTLRAQRHDHTTAVVGNYLYVLGGAGDFGFVGQGERASLNVSGSLGTFAIVPGVTLTMGRAAGNGAGVVLGRNFYVLGGTSGPIGVERSRISVDGSLGPFAPVPGVTMVHPRDGHTMAVIGAYLYVLGGGIAGDKSIERAAIGVDGSLGPFEIWSSVLVSDRRNSTSAVIDGRLYIVGGTSGIDAAATSVEEASINADGSLGPFSTFPGDSVTARSSHTTAMIGDYMYIIGGARSDGGGDAIDIYRAPVGTNSTLGSFEVVPSVTQSTSLRLAAGIGSYVYALGVDPVVQRATVDVRSGQLGPFVTVAGELTPLPPRGTSASIGNYFYWVGGSFARSVLNSVKQASLN